MKMINTLVALSAATTFALPVLAGEKETATLMLTQGLVQLDQDFVNRNVAPGYIQHNPGVADDVAGVLGFIDYLATLDDPVQIEPVRVLQDGDMVMVHSNLTFGAPMALFDLFRFEDGRIVEHWDGMQIVPETTASGNGMTDGMIHITDLDQTEANRALVTGFVSDVFINGDTSKIPDYIGDDYIQHNPGIANGIDGLNAFMAYLDQNGISVSFRQIHHVVAEGNFVLTHSEGQINGATNVFFDLFRVENGRIAEHWDVVQQVPEETANDNGMF